MTAIYRQATHSITFHDSNYQFHSGTKYIINQEQLLTLLALIPENVIGDFRKLHTPVRVYTHTPLGLITFNYSIPIAKVHPKHLDDAINNNKTFILVVDGECDTYNTDKFPYTVMSILSLLSFHGLISLGEKPPIRMSTLAVQSSRVSEQYHVLPHSFFVETYGKYGTIQIDFKNSVIAPIGIMPYTGKYLETTNGYLIIPESYSNQRSISPVTTNLVKQVASSTLEHSKSSDGQVNIAHTSDLLAPTVSGTNSHNTTFIVRSHSDISNDDEVVDLLGNGTMSVKVPSSSEDIEHILSSFNSMLLRIQNLEEIVAKLTKSNNGSTSKM